MTIASTPRAGGQDHTVLRALALAALTWPTAPVWAQDGIDLEALRDSYQPPAETSAEQEGEIVTPLPSPEVEGAADTTAASPDERFPDTVDGLIALVERELAGRPDRNVLSEACALVGPYAGAEQAWSRVCSGRADKGEAGQ